MKVIIVSMNVTFVITMDAKSKSSKTELYLLIIIVKLSIFAAIQFLKLAARAHKQYKLNIKRKYEKNKNEQLTKIVVQHENQPIPAKILLNPSDLHSSATSHHHTDLKK